MKPMGDSHPSYTTAGGVACYVVEAKPRSHRLPNYYCSNILYWIDREMSCPLRTEQYDQSGKLIMVGERLIRNQYPEDGRLGYTPLIFIFWRADIDLITAGFHDYHKKVDWLADNWQWYFSPEFLRRGWFLSPYTSKADVPQPQQFYLRPRVYPDKFPNLRQIALAPEVAKRVQTQEKAGHIVSETTANGTSSAE